MTTMLPGGRPVIDRSDMRELVPLIAVRELEPFFAERLSRDAVWSVVRHAVDDLRGSVHPEALAEMTFRLARYRLEAVVEDPSVAAGTAVCE